MRDASQLESDSVNDYINRISVDTGTSFYSRRGDGRMMDISVIIAIAIPLLMWLSGVVFISWNYIIKPHKSIRDGLSDWYHESDNDL